MELDQWVHRNISFLFPRRVISAIAGLEEAKKPSGEKVLRLIRNPFSDAEFGKNLARLSNTIAARANRVFEFQKRRQLFIDAYDETLSVTMQ